MGLDIYAGTYVRYFARNWKTVTMQFCENNGMQYAQVGVHNDIPEEEKASVEEIEEAVWDWQQQLVTVLQNSGIETACAWKEDNVKPYYTDKPDWDAFGALLLFGAAKLARQQHPERFEKNMNFYEHPLLRTVFEKGFDSWSLFSGTYHFVPFDDSFMFRFPLANGVETAIGTVSGLKYELSKLNEISWKADDETILSWMQTEGYPDDARVTTTLEGNKEFSIMEVHQTFDTESLAKFAFAILWQAVLFAEKEHVPIVFDY